MKKRILVTAFFICISGFFVSTANAEPVTISLSATVNYVDDPAGALESKINVGSIITGYYTYESTTPDSRPSEPSIAEYWHNASPSGISLTVGGFNFRTNPDNVNFLVSITNNYSDQDNYLLRSYNNSPLSNGTLVGHISWQLDDLTATVFSSDALPVTAPILSQWQFNHLRMDGDAIGGGTYLVDAAVTSVQLVPEPGTLLLLTLGSFLLRKRISN